MKKIVAVLAILSALFMNTCASAPFYYRSEPNHSGIHEEFKPYVQEFIYKSYNKVSEKDLKGLTMGFRKFEPDSNVAGLCYYTPFFKEIDINVDWWNDHQSQLRREELLFHELGHCVLYRPHTSPTSVHGVIGWFESLLFEIGILHEKGRLRDGCPVSYMHPNVISDFCINKHYNYYIKELYSTRQDKFPEDEDVTFVRRKNGCR